MPRPSVTPSNRSTTTTAAVAGSTRGGRGGGNKVRQTMNGLDIQQQNSYDQHHEKQQQNGGSSENVPPARGETKQQHQTSTIPPEKMETVSKGTGASKFLDIFIIPSNSGNCAPFFYKMGRVLVKVSCWRGWTLANQNKKSSPFNLPEYFVKSYFCYNL